MFSERGRYLHLDSIFVSKTLHAHGVYDVDFFRQLAEYKCVFFAYKGKV